MIVVPCERIGINRCIFEEIEEGSHKLYMISGSGSDGDKENNVKPLTKIIKHLQYCNVMVDIRKKNHQIC